MAKEIAPRRVVSFLFGLWKCSPKACFGMIFLQAISVTMSVSIAPFFVSQLITMITAGSATLSNSFGLLICYGLILFVSEVLVLRWMINLVYIAEMKMQSVVSARILDHLLKKSLGYHSNKLSGGTVSDASKLSNALEGFWDTILFGATPIVITMASVCIALCFVLWQYAIILALISIVFSIIIIRSSTKLAHLNKDVSEKSSAATAYLADIVGNIATVKAFASGNVEKKNFKKRVDKMIASNMKQMQGVLAMNGTFGALIVSLCVCAFLAAIIATEQHVANVGTIYLVITYSLSIVSRFWSISSVTRNLMKTVGNAMPMISTLDEDIEINDPSEPKVISIKNGLIELENVSFSHDDAKGILFRNFNLTVKSGERIGLVGKSGSGKTSLTRLLLRFSDVDKGEIKIDGQNIKQIRQDDLRRSIAYVPQEPVLFHRSLRENIAYGKMNASMDEIRQATKEANALKFIEETSDGFDTIVGERGIKLSGGQRQRIAIARAILKNAPILILDEATSALDSESEKLIQDALATLMKDRTCIVIAHRLSTIAKLDRIVVLDNGNIVEQGTHSDLIKQNGIYAKLWLHQSGGFLE